MRKVSDCLLEHFDSKYGCLTYEKNSELILKILSTLEDIVKFVLDAFRNTKITPQLKQKTQNELNNKLEILFDIKYFSIKVTIVLHKIFVLIENFTITLHHNEDQVVSIIEDWNDDIEKYNGYIKML